MSRSIFTIMAIILLFAAMMAGVITHYKNLYIGQIEVNQKIQKDYEEKEIILATQALEFNLFNRIATAQQDSLKMIDEETREKKIEYGITLKNEPTCAFAVPASIANRLFNYAYRLRTDALHAHSIEFDRANSGTLTGNTLTYCQAVLWIDPLIAAIEQANIQLAAIRRIESERHN